MAHRFMKRKKKTISFFLLILFLVYLSFSLIYNTLYKKYFLKLTTKEFVTEIINLNKNKKSLLDKYLTPEYLLQYTLDVNKEVSIPVAKNKEENAIVYIYSTHDTEKYSDTYLENYNLVPDVLTASYILKDYLEEAGIPTRVEDTKTSTVLKSSGWSYQRSYDASRSIITPVIEENDFKLIIDFHRDAIDKSKTTLEYNGEFYAKILFVIGGENAQFEENKKIADFLDRRLNEIIPDISRGVSVKKGSGVNGIYNQDINSHMLLIEVGSETNEINELNNTIQILSEVIKQYIGENS